MNLIKAVATKAAKVGIAAEILMMTLSAGVVIGMAIMAVAMVGLTNAPEAMRLAKTLAGGAL